jgi:hypothetical protein
MAVPTTPLRGFGAPHEVLLDQSRSNRSRSES